MARVNGKAPAVFHRHVASAKTTKVALDATKIEVGSRVVVRKPSGEKIEGTLTHHHDWLVGCPVVKDNNGQFLGIGYDGEIIELIEEFKP